MSGWAPQDAADPSLRDDASVPSLRHPRPNRVCVLFAAPARRCPFGNCFLSLERYLIIINYVAMGHRASSSAVKGLRLSHDLEKGKRKSLVCYNSSHLWVPSSPLEHLFFSFLFFMFSLFSIERVFVFQLDQRQSATDRRFDRSTNRTQSKGGKVFPWVRQLEN